MGIILVTSNPVKERIEFNRKKLLDETKIAFGDNYGVSILDCKNKESLEGTVEYDIKTAHDLAIESLKKNCNYHEYNGYLLEDYFYKKQIKRDKAIDLICDRLINFKPVIIRAYYPLNNGRNSLSESVYGIQESRAEFDFSGFEISKSGLLRADSGKFESMKGKYYLIYGEPEIKTYIGEGPYINGLLINYDQQRDKTLRPACFRDLKVIVRDVQCIGKGKTNLDAWLKNNTWFKN